MSEIQIREGNTIYEKGSPLTMLGMIMEGTVRADLLGESVLLKAGDVLGMLDLCTGIHSCTYTAQTDVVIDSYPYKTSQSLQRILTEEPSFCHGYAAAAARHFFAVADICHLCHYTCNALYSAILEYDREYSKLCKQYQVPAKHLPGLESVHPFTPENQTETYVTAYYSDIRTMCESPTARSLFSQTGFLIGLLMQASRDMHKLLNTCEETEVYLAQLSTLLINEEQIDFLDLYTSLLTYAAHHKEDTVPLLAAISKMFIRAKNVSSIPKELYDKRLSEHRRLSDELTQLASTQEEDLTEHLKEVEKKLKHSLTTLLNFSGMDQKFCDKLIADIDAYKNTADKTAVSPELAQLRTDLTQSFFSLYKSIFFASIDKNSVPEVVKMFLYFGYVDENLCGLENAAHLYSNLPVVRSDYEDGVYLFYDWLKLIYEGKKQPRCDEFDQDYPTYVQSLVHDGSISKEDAMRLLNDPKAKVLFELDNMFTAAVKITYGRLQTYCPLLSEHDFMKSPEETLINPSKVKNAFRAVTAIDYSAYCREVMFADPVLPNGRELIQREIFPDVILLPNIGMRAALWQEIEGRNRSTPACMLFPIFSLTDIQHLVIRLTGEFRWEMCKRMQGSRWNDVSTPSLTSEYFDYLQFYKKNKELSAEAKEKCRQQLTRVKNRFRESFVIDYMAWIMYEAKGSPHMNKVTRRIFMTYCPLSAVYRESLKKNPFYSAMIEKFENQKNKELTRMNSVVYRIQRGADKKVPAEIEQQIEFLKK